ncbi:MAG: hypothetical protein QG562_622 [Patescibacteria group bacterium]|nr:hypothetical protein [Patescibacteria group bacterium]
MWGAVGFISLAITFGLFAVVTDKIKLNKKIRFKTKPLAYAYVLMVGACTAWAFASISGTIDALVPAVIFGDLMLVVATILLLESFVPAKNWKIVEYSTVLVGAVFIVVRLFGIKPEPYMQSGILIFNTPRIISVGLALVFLGVWLLANFKLGKALIHEKKELKPLWPSWYFANLIAFIGFCGFIIAKKPLTISFSFTLVVIGYLTMLAIVYLYSKGIKKHGKR